MNVLVTGGTGFVGREVVRQLCAAGHKVRLISRHPRRASTASQAAQPATPFALPPEAVGGNVLEPASLKGAAGNCDAIVHLVGIISEIGEQTFENVHFHATQNVLAEAKRAGVKRWIHMSAIGARPDAPSRYHQTKWAAEETVRASGLDWTIFRPSIIYGPGDGFISLFARISRWSPVLPVMGNGRNLLQPVAVADVARCFVSALTEPASVGKTLDLCGPERLSFDQVLETILRVTQRRRLKLHVPMPLARLQAAVLEKLFPLVLRQAPPLNRDQLLMLREDNVGDGRAAEELFGVELRRFSTEIHASLAP